MSAKSIFNRKAVLYELSDMNSSVGNLLFCMYVCMLM